MFRIFHHQLQSCRPRVSKGGLYCPVNRSAQQSFYAAISPCSVDIDTTFCRRTALKNWNFKPSSQLCEAKGEIWHKYCYEFSSVQPILLCYSRDGVTGHWVCGWMDSYGLWTHISGRHRFGNWFNDLRRTSGLNNIIDVFNRLNM